MLKNRANVLSDDDLDSVNGGVVREENRALLWASVRVAVLESMLEMRNAGKNFITWTREQKVLQPSYVQSNSTALFKDWCQADQLLPEARAKLESVRAASN